MERRVLQRGRWALLAGTLALAPAAAQPTPAADGPAQGITRPAASERLVRLFDFEPTRREIYAIPRYWDLAQDGSRAAGGPRPGFPMFNRAELDDSVAYAGTGSVRLDARAGSTCLRLDAGVVPVFSRTEYVISAKVRTRGMTPDGARAAILARFLDKSCTPIPGAEARSELVAGQDWTTVTALLPGALDSAAFLQVDLVLLQPEQFRAAALGKHQVWPQDLDARAWFDEVAVVQLPRVTINAGSPTNIIGAPERPKISVSIRDLTGQTLTAKLTVQDAAAKTVDAQEQRLLSGQATWECTPRLPALGWYRATLELESGGRRVGSTYVDFAWLPSAEAAPIGPDRARFGLICPTLPLDQAAITAPMVEACGAGFVSLPVWRSGLTLEAIRPLLDRMVPLVGALRTRGAEVAIAFPSTPAELVANTHTEPSEPGAAFAASEQLWSGYLLPLIDKFGQGVQRWHIGEPGQRAAPEPGIAALRSFLERLVPGPIVGVTASPDFGTAPVGVAGEQLVSVPCSIPVDALETFFSGWSGGEPPVARTYILETLPQEFSPADRAAALTKAMVAFWGFTARPEASDARLAIRAPWRWGTPDRPAPIPGPELAVWRNTIDRLQGRRIVGRLPAAAGIAAYILAPAEGASGGAGAIVAWQTQPGAVNQTLEAYLADGPVTLVDMWGNSTPLNPVWAAATTPEQAGSNTRAPIVHRVPISADPVFIDGVDVGLSQLIASFGLDPAFISCTPEEHEIVLHLANPWRQRVDGRITILEPGGLTSPDPAKRDRTWRISPRSVPFSMPPGQETRIPITMALSGIEEAGPRDFIAELELSGQREYTPVRLRTTIDLRLEQLELDLSYRFAPTPEGPDLVVEAQVTNKGQAPGTVELAGFGKGYPRSKASISDLATGDSATRRFVFPGGAARLKGQSVSVSVQDTETLARITRSIVIE
jgi:hypothetical protein